MTTPALLLERKTFFVALPGLMALALVVALTVHALSSGEARRQSDAAAAARFEASVDKSLHDWRSALARVEAEGSAASRFAGRPMNIAYPAALAPAPLGDFAVGPSDLHPATATITPWNTSASLFSHYQFQNPTVLALGHFDLTFVVIVIMPLLMIAASFDVLGGERSRGTLRMAAAQAARLDRFVWSRLIVRNGALWLALMAIAAAAVMLQPPEVSRVGRVVRFAAWTGAAGTYAIFWFGLVVAAVAWLKRSETVAASLVAGWAVLVLAVPALADAAGEALNPPPSRLAYLSQMREAQNVANREVDRLTQGFLLDHPELTIADQTAPVPFHRSAYLANLEVERRTAPVLEALAHSHAERRALMERVQYVSPAIVVQNALNSIAGADVDRYVRFAAHARLSLARLNELVGSAVVSGGRTSASELDAFFCCEFTETSLEHVWRKAAGPLACVLLVAVTLLLMAGRRLAAPLERLL
ncbi:MAG TPA: DUF3526 domain-containing protein [Steroidobacteraceae bacterium]|nr:DUF3526 domain-containing protein [Steroidobacteraceae bacterium]